MISMRVLGIDPGIGIVGYGVVEKNNGQFDVIDFGVITTPKEESVSVRLNMVYDGISQLIDRFKPDSVAIEELFFFKNQKTIIPVAEARGVIVLACSQKLGNLYEYTPLQIKQALTGQGRAEKKHVQFMVKNILGLDKIPKPDDAADALAVAICHMQTNGIMSDNSL